MKKPILSWASTLLLILFAFVTQAQSQCAASNDCFDFRVVSATAINSTTTRITVAVKTNCDSDLSNVAFELPAGAVASNPVAQKYKYTVENPTNSPFYSIKFEGNGIDGYKNGVEDIFSYDISTAAYNQMTTLRIQAKAGLSVGTVTLNPKNCAPGDTKDNNEVCVATDECFKFLYKGFEKLPNGNVKVKVEIVTNCDNDLSYAAFEMPAGAKAKNPMATNYKYTIENGTNNPFYSVKFEGIGIDGYKNGKSDNFSFELTAAEFAKMKRIKVQAKAGQKVGTVYFDTDGCAPQEECPVGAPKLTITAPDSICNLADEPTTISVGQVQAGVTYSFDVPEGFIVLEEGEGSITLVAVFEEDQLGQPQTITVIATSECGTTTADVTIVVADCGLGSPFPVTMTSFDGVSRNGSVELTWSTASEINNDKFEVERSRDGKNFQKVGEVKGSGNSTVVVNYAFTDRNPATGTVYYRLRQVDLDKSFEYTKVIAVSHSASGSVAGMKVYPNPVTDGTVTVLLNEKTKGNVTVRLMDLAGRTLYNQQVSGERAEMNMNFSSLNLKPGIYLISVTANGRNTTQRIVVQ